MEKKYYLTVYSGGIRVWSWPAKGLSPSLVDQGLKELERAGYKDLNKRTETRYD